MKGTHFPHQGDWSPSYALANLYRDGQDMVSQHSDCLTTLGPLPTIASLTLGATRVFRLRPTAGHAPPGPTAAKEKKRPPPSITPGGVYDGAGLEATGDGTLSKAEVDGDHAVVVSDGWWVSASGGSRGSLCDGSNTAAGWEMPGCRTQATPGEALLPGPHCGPGIWGTRGGGQGLSCGSSSRIPDISPIVERPEVPGSSCPLVYLDVHLPHNSLLIMWPPCQEAWRHEVPRSSRISSHPLSGRCRVNLTFRHYKEEWTRRCPRCRCGRPAMMRCTVSKGSHTAVHRDSGRDMRWLSADDKGPHWGEGDPLSADLQGVSAAGTPLAGPISGQKGGINIRPFHYYYACDNTRGPSCGFWQRVNW